MRAQPESVKHATVMAPTVVYRPCDAQFGAGRRDEQPQRTRDQKINSRRRVTAPAAPPSKEVHKR